MKKDHLRVTTDVPNENIARMLRLNRGNRTTTVNAAISLYLDVQGQSVNRFGVDCHYFREKLLQLVTRIDNYTPEELARALHSLGHTANATAEREAINEEV